ncbi:hypothetical protein ScPMuIL_014042 [Solemya velum]
MIDNEDTTVNVKMVNGTISPGPILTALLNTTAQFAQASPSKVDPIESVTFSQKSGFPNSTSADVRPFQTSTAALENVSFIILHNITTEDHYLCTPPAYHEFPTDLFSPEQRAHGAIVLHLVLVLYMFVALALVCDDYFVTSLDKICMKLGFSEDVAGATFMAAGSSAPELFTAIIGVFITKGDVGVGTIVGSAVFNILFVIGICGLLGGQVIVLSWWPLCRDSVCYSLSVVILIVVVADGKVTWYESLFMLIMYAMYIVVMRFNVFLQAWVTDKVQKIKSSKILKVNGAALQTLAKPFHGDYEVFSDDDDDVFTKTEKIEPEKKQKMPVDEYVKNTDIKPGFYDFIFRLMMTKRFRGRTRFKFAGLLVISIRHKMQRDTAYQKRLKFRQGAGRSSVLSYTRSARLNWYFMTMEAESLDMWRKVPSMEEGYLNMFKWFTTYPLKTILYYTVPDCRKERWENWFMVTFILSIVWIAAFSYVMVWMVTLLGFALRIPDSVMGITFLAAGTSIPDAMASVFVARQGMGDMAVSNSLGSNVFDILLGLSLPWFLQTGIAQAGSSVQINSHGMLFSIILLFMTVIITVGAIRYTGWILNRCVGIICLSVYAIYLLFSVMIECNVFGYVNPPMCFD